MRTILNLMFILISALFCVQNNVFGAPGQLLHEDNLHNSFELTLNEVTWNNFLATPFYNKY